MVIEISELSILERHVPLVSTTLSGEWKALWRAASLQQ